MSLDEPSPAVVPAPATPQQSKFSTGGMATTALDNPPQAPLDPDVDAFWQAWEQQTPMTDHSLSHSASFTGSTLGEPSPWNTSSFDASTLASTMEFDSSMHGMEGTHEAIAQDISFDAMDMKNAALTTVAEFPDGSLQQDLSMHNEIDTALWAPMIVPDQSTQCSEDPFMGWAAKRVSHVFEDYSWVLSHVESL
jgi:hypothetical protein